MRDSYYFACLFVMLACAVAFPLLSRQLFRPTGNKSTTAITAAAACMVGFAASLPFIRTLEAPWLPLVAGAYFGTVLLATFFYRLSLPVRAAE